MDNGVHIISNKSNDRGEKERGKKWDFVQNLTKFRTLPRALTVCAHIKWPPLHIIKQERREEREERREERISTAHETYVEEELKGGRGVDTFL